MWNHFSGKSPALISDDHLRAIGAVVVNWSVMEMTLETVILGLYEVSPDRGLVLTNNISFQSKLTILRILAEHGGVKDEAEAANLKSLLKRIEDVGNSRNTIVHSLWSASKTQGLAHRHLIKVRGKRLTLKRENVALSEIEELSTRILTLRKQLTDFAVRVNCWPDMPGMEKPAE